MMDDTVVKALEALAARYGGYITCRAPLSERTTIGIGGLAEVWYEPASPEELRDAKKLLLDHEVPSVVIGKGSNVLFPDDGLSAVTVSLSAAPFCERKIDGTTLIAGAGAPLGGVIFECCNSGLGGMEGLVGIPGTIGGALRMNAGYRACISDCLEKALVMDEIGAMRWLEKKDLSFGYRYSSFGEKDVILQAVFRLKRASGHVLMEVLKSNFREKLEKQPLDKKTLGSVFKNPEASTYKSAQMIDAVGLKGRRRGGAVVSEKHANFIENSGGATAKDVISLMDDMKSAVREKFSVELETEIKIL